MDEKKDSIFTALGIEILVLLVIIGVIVFALVFSGVVKLPEETNIPFLTSSSTEPQDMSAVPEVVIGKDFISEGFCPLGGTECTQGVEVTGVEFDPTYELVGYPEVPVGTTIIAAFEGTATSSTRDVIIEGVPQPSVQIILTDIAREKHAYYFYIGTVNLEEGKINENKRILPGEILGTVTVSHPLFEGEYAFLFTVADNDNNSIPTTLDGNQLIRYE